jgi:formylglycine-generating enzyme required for sulfatase activity
VNTTFNLSQKPDPLQPYAHATRWTQGTGWDLLDTVLPGGTYAEATSTSDDGLTVVGFGDSLSGDRAVIWDSTQGSSSLEGALSMRGIAMDGWVLSEASAVSESARFVVGNGAIGNGQRGFVAYLGPPCRSDLSGDRFVNGDDLGRLLSDWGGIGPADLNRDGIVNGDDLGALLSGWGACPKDVVPSWAFVLEESPDPNVVTDASARAAIVATGLPWRVRDMFSGIEMLLVPPGKFQMGCVMGSNQYECNSWELPVHQVTLTNAFYLGRYEVTQAQWVARMGSNPSNFKSASAQVPADQVPNRPVERVSWNTIQGYLSATGFRLPTEAEWEYACRAGTETPFYNGSTDDSTVGTLAWYSPNSGGQTRPVGGKLANAFGFHDMLGNVWEWVNDWYGGYTPEAQTNPTGPASASSRATRGGWYASANDVRSSTRSNVATGVAFATVGFRVARTP